MVIRNARVMDPESGFDAVADLTLRDGVIVSIGPANPQDGEQVLDAAGLVAAPGFIDAHVHLRDPGQTYKEDLASGTLAAAYGGVTTVLCMPNTVPVLDQPEQIKDLLCRSWQEASCRVLPIAAVTTGQNGERLVDFDALSEAGAAAFSDDGHPVPTGALMREAMLRASKSDKIVISHCEDMPLGKGVMHDGEVSRELGLAGIPASAEEIMAAREIVLSAETGIPVHLAHLSTAGSVALVRDAKARGVKVTCETCPHYLLLDHTELRRRDANYKMNPPLRRPEDVEAVKAALSDGTIDLLVTDHAPHAEHEKVLGLEQAPNGILGLQTSFAAARTALPELPLMTLLERMTIAPAKVFGLPYGRIQEGAPADLVLLDPDEFWTVRKEDLVSKSKNSPFIGMTLKGRVHHTICNGRQII